MTFTQVYATLVLPALVARVTFELAPSFGLEDAATYLLSALGFLASALIGYEVERHHFRDLQEGKEMGHYASFCLGLPAVYAASIGSALFFFAFTTFPFF